jgi:hypothetical protein
MAIVHTFGPGELKTIFPNANSMKQSQTQLSKKIRLRSINLLTSI